MDEDQLTQEQALQVWNEEASKLGAGEEPAAAALGDAPADDQLPQNSDQAQEQGETPAPTDQQAAPQVQLPQEVMAALAKIPQLEQANAQLLHHVKTAEGRVAAMQREFQQARQAATTVAPQDAPSQGQMAAAAKNPEKWEQLKEDFPEWASAMEEYVGAQLKAVRPQQAGITTEQVAAYVQEQLASERAQMQRLLEEARIEGKHDNWRAKVNTTEFAQWFAAQAPEVRALADSPRAVDAIRMLDLFDAAKVRPASEIRQERGARLAAAVTTRPGQAAPPKSAADMTPEEMWNYEAAKREKTRAQRGF